MPPQLKEGLWSVTTQTSSNPGAAKIQGNSSICRDHAHDEKARAHAKRQCKAAQLTSRYGNTAC